MRETYLNVLKRFFYEHLIHSRYELRLTQAQMGRLLAMEERSYAYLESGKTSCGGLTLARFLIYCCEDPAAFLAELRKAFEKEADHAA